MKRTDSVRVCLRVCVCVCVCVQLMQHYNQPGPLVLSGFFFLSKKKKTTALISASRYPLCVSARPCAAIEAS